LVEEATTKIGVEVLASLLVPWTVRMAVGVEELMPTLELFLTTRMEVPEEEVTLKGSRVPVPLILKLTVEDVALTPATTALSNSTPVDTVVVPVHTVTYPLIPPARVPPAPV
jgi:hypothetical protein